MKRLIAAMIATHVLTAAVPGQTVVVPATQLKASAQVAPAQSAVGAAIMIPPPGPSSTVDDPDLAAALAQAGAVAGTAAPAGPQLSNEQLDDLRRSYNSSSEADRESLRAYFKDMGIDIAKLLGGPDQAVEAQMQSLAQAVRAIEFTRTPASVLAARSKIGFSRQPKPSATDFAATAAWLQTQVLAGEWTTLESALADLPPSDAIAAYTQILQTINSSQRGGDPNQKPDPGLLPEDVLALADAAPEPLSDWQVTILAGLLKEAATKYSTDPMLRQLDANTKAFGRKDVAQRERTVKFLVGAGLALEAAAYFPPIDEARAKLDAQALFNYASYHEELGASNRGGIDAQEQARLAWQLYCEVALIESADAKLRQGAIARAIDLLPAMPPSLATAWLKQVFANEVLAPAALEIIALKAVSLGNSSLDLPQRVQTILTMKESVDTLLAQTGMDINLLRVPLRMLTTALVGEAELALGGGNGLGARRGRRGPAGPQEKELLLKAMPDERWMSVLEPSLASRVYRAAIGIATSSDEIDVAIDYLSDAVERFPQEGAQLADGFLREWISTMHPESQMDGAEDWQYIGFVRNSMSSAPLTRGRQRRNIDRLSRLMLILDEIGVDPRGLPNVAHAFAACHGSTEVFKREGITGVFGPIEQLSAETAARLADHMRQQLSGEWRDRRAQQAAGMKRSPAEIVEMVERGYALAIALIDAAIAQSPHSWKYAVTKAGLTYDRVQYAQEQKRQDFAVYNQFRKEAFEAFAQTAARYAEVVSKGDQRDDPAVYLAWFSAAVGATELNYLTPEDLLVEGSPQDDQIDLIAKSIAQLPPEIAQRHTAAFAHEISSALNSMQPEVKARVVRHAMRIIGDHPAGASLRRLGDLYRDLMKDEIKLRLAIDGDDRVGNGKRFGATLLLRFTAEVDRETGGFSRYLQNDVWARVGNTYRPMQYRDLLKKAIESSFGDGFELEAIGFFESLAPPKPVIESGSEGWLEKPVAYLVLKAKDPSVDRLPPVSMDMHFNDTAGPVVLPITSNSPPVDATSAADPRPMRDLEIAQTLDLREIGNSQRHNAVTLEIHAKARGIIPELDDLLPGIAQSLGGYEVKAGSTETRPIVLLESDADASAMRYGIVPPPTQRDYEQADESGTYRLESERSWLVTFTPSGQGAASAFTFPALASSLKGKSILRQFADMDIVEVNGNSVAVPTSRWTPTKLIVGIVIIGTLVTIGVLVRRRRPAPAQVASAMPTRITPMSVITSLRRVARERDGRMSPEERAALEQQILDLERSYFGPAQREATPLNGEAESVLRGALARWS